MNIFLIRHGEAEPTSDLKPHELRELTPKGSEIVRNSAAFWKQLIGNFDVILTSPLKRARQTADIINEVFKAQFEVLDETSLLNGGSTEDLLAIAGSMELNDVAMVGHQPDIGFHIASMIGSEDSNFKVSTSSIAKIYFSGKPVIGKGALEFLLPAITKKG